MVIVLFPCFIVLSINDIHLFFFSSSIRGSGRTFIDADEKWASECRKDAADVQVLSRDLKPETTLANCTHRCVNGDVPIDVSTNVPTYVSTEICL